MIEFQGTYFDGRSSRAYPVKVNYDGVFLRIKGKEGYPDLHVRLGDCTIVPPLGNTARSIKLPDGAQCDTNDLKAIAALEHRTGQNYGMRLVHFLESRWRLTAGFLIGLVICVWVFTAYGIPFLAQKIAYSVPSELSEELSRQTIKMLDGRFLKRSELSREKGGELRAMFQKLCKDFDPGSQYRLEFRKNPYNGPNAFALPSGLIIMTDELVGIAESARELEGVLLHEIVHVKNRHGLRSIIQNAGVFMLISALLGDITSITSTAASLPALLAESGYSRKFEREADRTAAIYFIQKGWSIKPFQDIILRITKDIPNYPGDSFLSSHPAASERVKYLQEIEESGRYRG